MAPMSGGPTAKASKLATMKKKKYTTLSTKRHRFESFSERIGKLSIHPVRRANGARIRSTDSIEKSYFRTALNEWKDTNLSETFTKFVKEIDPLCQSLPQLLYHQERVAKILIEYMNKADALALEPILDLVAQFAHDLVDKFEVYFFPVVSAVNTIAATHKEVEAIEWSFNCLAWLFKYLSHLLTPDLRPLYDLMAPILGKTHQKSFVTRFAAEAMSFLVKKTGAMYYKDPNPLNDIVEHIFLDLSRCSEEQQEQYKFGIANLFAESIKGIQRGVNVSAQTILRVLLTQLFHSLSNSNGDTSGWKEVVEAVVINLVHHTDANGFEPVVQVLFDKTYICQAVDSQAQTNAIVSLAFAAIGARKATRVKSWTNVLEWVLSCAQTIDEGAKSWSEDSLFNVMCIAAVTMTYCPLDALIPVVDRLVKLFTTRSWDQVFLKFCAFMFDLDPPRFHDFFLVHFRKFLLTHWAEQSDLICLLLPRLDIENKRGLAPVNLPAQLCQEIESAFGTLRSKDIMMEVSQDGGTDDTLYLCRKYLILMEHFDAPPDTLKFVDSTLLEILALPRSYIGSVTSHNLVDFTWTKGLLTLAQSETSQTQLRALWPQICSTAEFYKDTVLYLHAITVLLDGLSMSIAPDNDSSILFFMDSIIPNLQSPSHDLRLATLELLDRLSSIVKYEGDAIKLALTIERSPRTHEHARSITLAARRLGAIFTEDLSNTWLKNVICLYCFGMLQIQFTTSWEAACDALTVIISAKGAEEIVVNQALSWLQQSSNTMVSDDSAKDGPHTSYTLSNDFQCSNLAKLQEVLEHSSNLTSVPSEKLSLVFSKESNRATQAGFNNRSQALRVFNKLPQVAEKRSRVLVPILLDWSLDRFADHSVESMEMDSGFSSEANDITQGSGKIAWPRREQKDLLDVFSKFRNPGSLYRSEDVYTALMNLLCNGDALIQKAALKTLSIWKENHVKKYEENLNNLLDDSRFREELTIFLDMESETSVIQHEDQSNLMPIILRLLYGRVISRTAASTKHGGQHGKRRAVLGCLHRFGEKQLSDFISIALGPLDNLLLVDKNGLNISILDAEVLSPRRQAGMLKLLLDMIEVLAIYVSMFTSRLVNAILYCSIRAVRKLQNSNAVDESDLIQSREVSLERSIRTDSIRSLSLLFAKCEPDVSIFGRVIVEELIEPRLNNLPIETAQSISSILRLFSVWASSNSTMDLLYSHKPIMSKVSECLVVPSAKSEVKRFVLDNIISCFCRFADENVGTDSQYAIAQEKARDILQHGLGLLLIKNIIIMLKADPPKDCLESGVKTLLLVEPYSRNRSDENIIYEIIVDLLHRPSGLVDFRMKGELLTLLKNRTASVDLKLNFELYETITKSVADLFNFFTDTRNRILTVTVFDQLTMQDESLQLIGQLCSDLNAYTTSRLNEPDFDRRIEAFQKIVREEKVSMTARQWYPIIKNMLYFIQDNEEIAIRSGASMVLRYFVQTLGSAEERSVDIFGILTDVVVPAVQRGLRTPSELVRSEQVSILSEIVSLGSTDLRDMQCLLGPDDESSFFDNILHIQQHRRIRALKRLARESIKISPKNISKFCIPLIENYLDATDENSLNLSAEAVTTYEKLAGALDWQRYRQILNRWIAEAVKMESKLSVRVLGALVNALYHAHKSKTGLNTIGLSALASSVPEPITLANNLETSILGRIMEKIHFKDESAVDIRVLLAVSAVKLIMTFPEDRVSKHLTPILIDICNVLRSKSQEARDVTRKTIAEIAAVTGPKYFPFIIKQLRSSLLRGSQLHVLAFTVHSLLLSVSTQFDIGDNDDSIGRIVEVIIEDVLGVVGQEKEAKDYISQMKEVRKKSLSYDSMEIIASTTSLKGVKLLIAPLDTELSKPRPKFHKVEELLRRLREGLRRNSKVKSQDFLVLCYDILTIKSEDEEHKPQSYVIISFAYDLLRRALDKHEELKRAENLASLVPILTKSIKTGNEVIQLSAFKLLTSIIKVPLEGIDQNVELYLDQVKRVLESSSSTNTPLAQSALKLMAAILRERPNAMIKISTFEEDVAYALERVKPDLRDPAFQGDRDRQVAAFNFLRAVLGRGIIMKEIYEVMDIVREVMITTSEHPIPDLSRSAYSRFVLDYFPEGGKGFSKQVDYLNSNLQYPHASGRKSVMEVMIFILNKMNDIAVQSVIMEIFLPLVVVLVSDDAEDCRSSAEILINRSLGRADKERTKMLKSQMQKWLTPEADELWQIAGLICWKLYFEVHTTSQQDAKLIHEHIMKQLGAQAANLSNVAVALQLSYLHLLKTICEKFPNIGFAKDTQSSWVFIAEQMNNTISKVISLSADLINLLLTDCARATAKSQDIVRMPLKGSAGLQMDNSLALKIAQQGFGALRDDLDIATLDKIVQIISFLGRTATGDSNKETLESLLLQAASQARKETGTTPPRARVAILKLITSWCNGPDIKRALLPVVKDIILPLQNLTDSAIPTISSHHPDFAPAYEELVASAHELLSKLQQLLGSSEFLNQVQAVQKGIRERRENRRTKRRIEAVSNPEKTERLKHKKHEATKIKRKAKNALAAGKRRGY